MCEEIWECDEDEARLWEVDPDRAARLTYLRLQLMWRGQVEDGTYRGIPDFRKTKPAKPITPALEPRVRRDESASSYQVPADVQRQFAKLLAA